MKSFRLTNLVKVEIIILLIVIFILHVFELTKVFRRDSHSSFPFIGWDEILDLAGFLEGPSIYIPVKEPLSGI